MIEGQTNIFEMLYPTYKITKPIRLIEFFAGYGSQALAFKYLGVKFEHWKICEWAIKSIQAYKDIHFPNDYHPAGVMDIPKEEIIDYLYKKGISNNYNEPMTLEQIKRLKDVDLYNIYENIYVTNNLVNIQQVKGVDLEIKDTDQYDYILTYSFPCQDLSLAGTRKLMSDTSTRSGMLWEVERILTECKELGTMPQVLLMENVPQVHGEGAIEDFNKWQLRLEELGYKNYWQDLIATDYGIPQTRNRCFMISILGDYNYTFPKPIPLKLKLKDILEDNVNGNYYLTNKQINEIKKWNAYQKPLETMEQIKKSGNSPTLTTRSGAYAAGMVLIDEKYYLSDKMIKYIVSEDDKYKVNENNLVINRELACSKTTREGNTRADTSDYICKDLPENTNLKGITKENMRIRKLIPREAFRLMGVKDEDYEKCAKNQSDSSLYHLAGDSIVVNVLMAIFKEMI